MDASRFREAEHIPAETVLEYTRQATKTKEKPTRKNLVAFANVKGIKKPIKAKQTSSNSPRKLRAKQSIRTQLEIEDAIVSLSQLPQPFSYKKIKEMGYGRRSLPVVARYIPWVTFTQVNGPQMARDDGSWNGNEMYTLTIDREFQDLSNIRKNRPDLSLAEISLLVARNPETGKCFLDNLKELLDSLRIQRKANRDEQQRARWNSHSVDAAQQHETLNAVENSLNSLCKSLEGRSPRKQ